MSDVCEIINPWTAEAEMAVPYDTPEAVDAKIAQAQSTFLSWRDRPLADRIAVVERFVALALASRESAGNDITRQMGKPITQAKGEMGGLAQRARAMCAFAEEALSDHIITQDDGIARRILKQPLGPIVDIAAWNYPLLTAVNAVVPAVLAGNTVLLKHAEQTAQTGIFFEQTFRAAGAPEGLVTAVTVPIPRAKQLLHHPLVSGVCFTGSVPTGKKVYETVAARPTGFIDVALELGGKDPAYVREDMPLDVVVPNLVEGAFYNGGQSCCAVERIYVHRSLYREFVERFVVEAGGWTVGDPALETTTLGPLAQVQTVRRLSQQVEDARARGGNVLLGGQRVEGSGWSFEATVIADCNQDMTVMREESFGPIIGISPVDNDDEAIAMMNDTRFGLTASIWTADITTGETLARQVQAGTVFVNRCDHVDPALPWTGLKDSGKGLALSHLGFGGMTRARGIHVRPLELLL